MKPDSIEITYKSKKFTLDRVSAEDKHFKIGFASRNWGVRIYPLSKEYVEKVRIIIEKSVVKKDGDGTSTQFMWDCYCMPFGGKLHLCCVNDPATCKRIGRRTRWRVVEPLIDEIYSQLKAGIDEVLLTSE